MNPDLERLLAALAGRDNASPAQFAEADPLKTRRISFAQWHTEMEPERQAAIFQEVFGGKV